MRCIRLAEKPSLDNLTVTEAEKPEPGPGEVLLRVGATSLNWHDYLDVSGAIPTAPGRIPMSDGAGEIVAVGKGVDDALLGTQAMGTFFPLWRDGPPSAKLTRTVSGESTDGFACEYALVEAGSLTPVPRGYTAAEAATLPCAGVTAWRALAVEGQLRPGDHAIVMGTGGLALFAIQIAAAMGVHAIVISSSDEKLEFARELGAAHTINYRRTPEWSAAVQEITGGIGADLSIDIGGDTTLPQSLKAIRTGGRVLLVGRFENDVPKLDFRRMIMDQIALDGIAVGSREHQCQLVDFIDRHGFRPHIDRRFELSAIPDAFRHQLGREHMGKIVVEIG